jgi:uncharacterized membrane protein
MSPSVTVYILLRILHVVIGAFWVGAVVFVAAFLLPSIRAAGPAGGAVMQQLMHVRRLALWLMAAAVLTVLSGLTLYGLDSAGFRSAWLGSGPGRVFGLGGVLAIGAVIVGMAVNSPAARRLSELTGGVQAAGRPATPDELAAIQRLQARLARGSLWAAVLLILATTAMAVARYVP